MNTSLEHVYNLPLNCATLVLHDNLLKLALAMMAQEEADIKILATHTRRILRVIGVPRIKLHRDQIQLLVKQSIKNDEIEMKPAHSEPSLVDLLEAVFGFQNTHFIDEHTVFPDNPPSDTDPICPDCGVRHP